MKSIAVKIANDFTKIKDHRCIITVNTLHLSVIDYASMCVLPPKENNTKSSNSSIDFQM